MSLVNPPGGHDFVFEEVSFRWPGGRQVLARASFSISSGVFAVVRGASGAGKSTLLRLMNRLEEPQHGRISYRGRGLVELDPPRLRQKVAYLHQMPVIPDLTVRRTLLMPFDYQVNSNRRRPADDDLVAALETVHLGSVALDERAAALSVGQRQRLCLLRSLMTDPEVLLLDEPTASLDRDSEALVLKTAAQRCAAGTTVVMASHGECIPPDVPVTEILLKNGQVEVTP